MQLKISRLASPGSCPQEDISTVINTCTGFYCEDFVAGHVATFPDQPLMWTESMCMGESRTLQSFIFFFLSTHSNIGLGGCKQDHIVQLKVITVSLTFHY